MASDHAFTSVDPGFMGASPDTETPRAPWSTVKTTSILLGAGSAVAMIREHASSTAMWRSVIRS